MKKDFLEIREALELKLREDLGKLIPVIGEHNAVEGTALRFILDEFKYEAFDSRKTPVPVGMEGHIRFLMSDYVDNNEGNYILFRYLEIFADYFSEPVVLNLKSGLRAVLSVVSMDKGSFGTTKKGTRIYSKTFYFEVE